MENIIHTLIAELDWTRARTLMSLSIKQIRYRAIEFPINVR